MVGEMSGLRSLEEHLVEREGEKQIHATYVSL